jgi:hypothetical protein
MSLTLRALLRVKRELRAAREHMCRWGGEIYLGQVVALRMRVERLTRRSVHQQAVRG